MTMIEQATPRPMTTTRTDGYRGIWYALGYHYDYGDRYSGGLGTYTSNHQPMAVHAPGAGRTFFTYGGTTGPDKRELTIMVSYYDHRTGTVPRPVQIYLDPSVDDPHDNASIQVDPAGHVWVFKSGRHIKRPGIVFRSVAPYEIDAFERVGDHEFTYPQVWHREEAGFFLLFTKYLTTPGKPAARELYWKTSPDGRAWSEDRKLAGFGGHYQTSGHCSGKVATFFNWHPDGDNNGRTNLYYAQTTDWGRTWTTADGRPLDLPLRDPANAALVLDLKAQGKRMYTCDLNFDARGNPILLFIVSLDGNPGPKGGPREWTLLHWTGTSWETRVITASDHNYDMGSLYVEGGTWRVIGPTETGPQPHGTGGEMALWVSTDEGGTWNMERKITRDSAYNHSYARRPLNAVEPFFAFWADGHAAQMSPSRLYFTSSQGERVWRLPYDMTSASASPDEIS